MTNAMKVMLLTAGCACLLGFTVAAPHAQASDAGVMVLAQNDDGKRGFLGLFGGSKSKSKANSPVYVGGQNTGGESGSAGRSGSTAVGKLLGSSSNAQQRASSQAKESTYHIPPSQPVDAVAMAEARLLKAQREGAAARLQWQAEYEAKTARAEAELAKNGGAGYRDPAEAQQRREGEGATQTRTIYKRDSDSGRKPIRLFNVE